MVNQSNLTNYDLNILLSNLDQLIIILKKKMENLNLLTPFKDT